jgi:pilus assembly protein CpaF
MLSRFTKLTSAGRKEPESSARTDSVVAALADPAQADMDAANRVYTDVKVRLHQRLLEEINLAAIEKLPPEAFREQTAGIITRLLKADRVQLNQREQVQITDDVIDEMIGLGPLEPLLKDPSINDILVNTHRQVFIERQGRLELTPVIFQDERHLLRIINKIVSAVGRRVDESQPMMDARLADGSRVNVAIAPVAIDGPLLSIRKFAARPFTLDSLVANGSITEEISTILKGVVQCRLNVLISGGTGSGKTTMLNAMSRYIDGRERIITIEDAAELQLQQIHVARMETRPPNVEGRGEIRQRELVKNALRMRPDRIIVGEVRGGEAFDMLQAMNTGHEGSMTTVHANTPRDALSRLEQMIGMADLDLSARSMRHQIASALHVVIQLQRLSDGRRKLVSLTEITGMEGEVVQLQEIFRFVRRRTDSDGTVHGEFRPTGIRPRFMAEFQTRGIEMPPRAFEPDRVLG